ncbi:MAG: DUF4238 domain-containing protein [Propionivibrio sp.]|nr:DUF4238 domain-containing protein [Propionivibrio sp.]
MSAVRHHFVPQGFLRGFASDDDSSKSFVWVYEKGAGRAPRKKSVRSIAWAPAYYAQEREDGTEDLDSIETGLAQTIDNRIPVILKGIQPKPGEKVFVSEEDRAALSFFIGLSLTRVPSFRDGINDMYSQVAQFGLAQLAMEDSTSADLIEKYGVKATAKPWVSLRPMIEVAKAIADSALRKSWQFFLPPSEVPLATSDNPVVISGAAVGLPQLGPAHPGAELVINLRKDLALVCTPKRGYPSMQVFSLSSSDARKFNRGIVRAARQRVFANHESSTFDRFVKKYADEEQRVIV